MASDGSFLIGLVIGAVGGAWAASALATHKEDKENLKLRKQLETDIHRNKITFETKELFYKELEKQFINGYNTRNMGEFRANLATRGDGQSDRDNVGSLEGSIYDAEINIYGY